jgi:hypothetical protein
MTPDARSLADRFLAAYNHLDEYMRIQLHQGLQVAHKNLIVKMAEKRPDFTQRQFDLLTFCKLAQWSRPQSFGAIPD